MFAGGVKLDIHDKVSTLGGAHKPEMKVFASGL
jgi:hypothetical protein